VIPIPWVTFPLTESSHNPPKSLPIALRDPVFLTNKPDTEWYPSHWVIFPDTEWYPSHWVIFPDTEWYPLPWVPANRISDWVFQPIGYRTDGRTHTDSFIYRDETTLTVRGHYPSGVTVTDRPSDSFQTTVRGHCPFNIIVTDRQVNLYIWLCPAKKFQYPEIRIPSWLP
jgi:hypothetical protein